MTEIPDHVPAGMRRAEGWRMQRDALRDALDLPEDELRQTVAWIADQLAGESPDSELSEPFRLWGDNLRRALKLSADDVRDTVASMADAWDETARQEGQS
jgi:hypothetical protein